MERSGTAHSETIYETAPDTRRRILRVSTELFGVHGFHETSLREIAERVGVSKPAVLYHFPGKADILGALVEPVLRDLAAALARAAAAGASDGPGAPDGPGASDRARWAAIEGVLDVWLAHRHLLRLNLQYLQDTAQATPGPVFAQLRDALLRANFLVAGANPGFAERVRAAQAVAMLSDPVVLFADAPVPALREAVLDGVRRLLDGPDGQQGPGGPARPVPGGRRGRPVAMSPAMIEAARRMHAAGSGATAIAAALGVSRATVYRHLPQEESSE
ncbi:TetR family transcriptional regulator [Streptomyces sp. TBY4]|uniref:TetR family transcriptional regulator n=1 Tax=Streptomyces sp. TBY4 TaxID=2962030 RepID=UPI0020B6D1BD|nr:TetR family transcriptional regulator [Streptomyces sp. TBY4]MCP3757460.1 TetR family transcriptional regulator [Streptomyces sp. TBY4]